MRAPTDPMSAEGPAGFLGPTGPPSCSVFTWRGARGLSVLSFVRAVILSWGLPPHDLPKPPAPKHHFGA